MKDILDHAILKLYRILPDNSKLKNNKKFLDIVGKIASEQIQQAKQDIIQKRWEAVRLENQLNELKNKK